VSRVPHPLRLALKLALGCVIAAFPGLGQTTRGSIAGAVTDPSGSVVPAANVKVTQLETGFTHSTSTNTDGNYVTPALLPGRYRVEVGKPGFQTKIVEPVEVNVDAHVQVNVALDVKGTQEIVTVDAKGAQIEADSTIEYTSFSWTSQLAF